MSLPQDEADDECRHYQCGGDAIDKVLWPQRLLHWNRKRWGCGLREFGRMTRLDDADAGRKPVTSLGNRLDQSAVRSQGLAQHEDDLCQAAVLNKSPRPDLLKDLFFADGCAALRDQQRKVSTAFGVRGTTTPLRRT